MNTVYSKRCGLFLGFHGCDASVRDALLSNPQDIKISTNKYDWLGSGFYVWENNMERALDWACHNKNIKNPSVIGITYELGNCLDLMDTDSINVIRDAYSRLLKATQEEGLKLPQNKDLPMDVYHDKLLRNLDCAIINHTTKFTDRNYLSDLSKQGYSLIEPYDTVRGCFTEGGKQGTYAKKTNQTGMYFIAQDQFWKADAAITINPFRAWFEGTPASGATSFNIVVEGEEDASGISELKAENGMQKDGKFMENGKVVIVRNGVKYSISGQNLR